MTLILISDLLLKEVFCDLQILLINISYYVFFIQITLGYCATRESS